MANLQVGTDSFLSHALPGLHAQTAANIIIECDLFEKLVCNWSSLVMQMDHVMSKAVGFANKLGYGLDVSIVLQLLCPVY